MHTTADFAQFCCELLAAAGPCTMKRMFGGWGISVDGLTFAIVADLGAGERLYLKADASSTPDFEAAGCERFTYLAKGVAKSMAYYTAPESAMDAAHDMAPWARRALQAALSAANQTPKPRSRPNPRAQAATKSVANRTADRTSTSASRSKAAAISPKPARKSAKG